MKKVFFVFIILVGAAMIAVIFFAFKNLLPSDTASADPPIAKKEIPLAFSGKVSLSVFAKNLKGPRVLIEDPSGVLIASLTAGGKVVALPDPKKTGQAEKIITVAQGLNSPHGLAFYCFDKKCSLYVAENNQVAVYDYDQKNFQASNKKKIIDLPGGGVHFTRTLLIKDKKLYISIGSTCNVCNESDSRRAKILQTDLDGKILKVFASGLRNSVFMAVNPADNKIWATEMGRDYLGDNLPPDEINIIEEGKNYGWPICFGKNIHDNNFDHNTYIRNPCMEPFETPSQIDIPAHSAPLGLAFVPSNSGWPKDLENNLLVAYHGSWNRSVPTGYKIVRVKLDAKGNAVETKDFISGWLKNGQATSRPVGILLLPGGRGFISDDKGGQIFSLSVK